MACFAGFLWLLGKRQNKAPVQLLSDALLGIIPFCFTNAVILF